MIYTRKKNPEFLDFFCRKKWNFRGILLAKKKGDFPIKKKKKLFAENRKKMWKNFCRPSNVFWQLIRHYRPLGKNPRVFESHNHDIWVKKWKNSGKFSDFFFGICRNFCTQGQKTTFVEKIFLRFLLCIWANIAWKYKKFSLHTKKVIFYAGF